LNICGANFWHALALAYHKTGRRELARRAARRALEAARTRQEREMAEAALALTGREPAWVELPGRPQVTTPETWFRKKGDHRAEGILERIDCVGTSARFHVRTAEGPLALWVDNPGAVLLQNASSLTFKFSCGEQAPRTVAIEYIARPDAEKQTAGIVTAIKFR